LLVVVVVVGIHFPMWKWRPVQQQQQLVMHTHSPVHFSSCRFLLTELPGNNSGEKREGGGGKTKRLGWEGRQMVSSQIFPSGRTFDAVVVVGLLKRRFQLIRNSPAIFGFWLIY
jgi:hypothetical protein